MSDKPSQERPQGTSWDVVRVLFKAFGYLVFFGWNLWFFVWMWFGLGPVLLMPMTVAVFAGMVPLPFALCGLLLLLMPALGLLAAALPRFRTDPGRLLSLFYGVQAPVMLLLAVRMFAIQQLTLATGLLLAIGFIGSLSLVRTLWSGPREAGRGRQLLRLFAQTSHLVVGLWCALVAGLYGFSISAAILAALPDVFYNVFRIGPEVFVLSIWVVFAVLFAIVLAAFPVALVGISVRSYELVLRASKERLGAALSTGVSAATVLAWLLAFALASRQPQGKAFAWMKEAKDDAGRRVALEHREEIREGLLFARLASERTFDADPEGEHMEHLWRPLVGETLATIPAGAYRFLFGPFLYHPVRGGWSYNDRSWMAKPNDVFDAKTLYADLFDAPIEVAERKTLLAAARQTWSWEDAQAGLLEVGQQKVHLDRQDVIVEPHGDVARVFVHDVYRNRTWDPQEVLVYFSLPETAAVTGLWLGPDEEHRFSYVVAPRGAAQEVYERQVQIRRDPALLEQTGPVQYRLRAFPVLAREGRADDVWSIRSEGPEMHLWMELVVPLSEDEDGMTIFELPRSNEVRNLFWDEDTERTIGGEVFSSERWLPEAVPAPGAVRQARSVRIGEHVVAAEPAGPITPSKLRRPAILVDGTASMAAHREALARSLAEIRAISEEPEIWCTVEGQLARCPAFDPQTALFFGSVALETRLAELAPSLAGNETLIVLTDEGSYTLAAEAERAGLPDITLPETWLVHLGGDHPDALPDWTADRLQRSNGGVVSSIEELSVRHADPSCRDGMRFSFRAVDPARSEPEADKNDPFVAIAARQLVAMLDAEQRSSGLSSLDTMHAVAVANHVVTPYSSMLVLVDDFQRKELEEANKREDRFDREITDGQETTVSAAPEPSSLLLLGFGAAALAAFHRRKGPAAA